MASWVLSKNQNVTDRVMFLLSRVASHEEAFAISRHKEEVEQREFGRRK